MQERGTTGASPGARDGRVAGTIATILLLLAGCRTPVRPYSDPGLGKTDRTKLAILPFENLSKSPSAGKTIEGMILVELLKQARIPITDPGEVAAALSKERVRIATAMSKETLAAVAATVGVDLVLVGTVHDYDMQSAPGTAGAGGPVPVVALSVRVLDAREGGIVWAANVVRRGNDRETVFGIGRVQSLNTLAEETATEMAKAFAASIGTRP